jgi:hypothetical protein
VGKDPVRRRQRSSETFLDPYHRVLGQAFDEADARRRRRLVDPQTAPPPVSMADAHATEMTECTVQIDRDQRDETAHRQVGPGPADRRARSGHVCPQWIAGTRHDLVGDKHIRNPRLIQAADERGQLDPLREHRGFSLGIREARPRSRHGSGYAAVELPDAVDRSAFPRVRGARVIGLLLMAAAALATLPFAWIPFAGVVELTLVIRRSSERIAPAGSWPNTR